MVYIPLELVELIVERLDSRPTLHICALVCKTWLSAVFRLLFRRFVFDVDSPPAQPPDIHTPLVFPHYVHELTIKVVNGSFSKSKDALPPLSLFNRAHRISLKLWGPHYGLICQLPRTHLRELDLHIVSFPDFRSLQIFIAAIPHLEALFMYKINQDGPQDNANNCLGDPHPPLYLRVLRYSAAGAYRSRFLHWLSVYPPTLEHLSLTGICFDELESTSALLCALGPHLCTFNVSFNRVNMTLAHPLLHANTHLHTLCITVSQGSTKWPGVPILITLLGSASPALRCVTLELLDVYHYLHDHEWRALDAALTCHAPSLECLHVGVHTRLFCSNMRGFDRAAREYMPYCSENGILAGVDSLDVRDRNRTRTPAHGKLQCIMPL